MRQDAHWIQRVLAPLWMLAVPFAPAQAGGSALHVAVVVNSHSADSMALGNYYRERRQLAPQNIVRISWTGSRTDWTRSQCQNLLVNPLLTALTERRLAGQIRFVVLSMDIPYRVIDGRDVNSTTSVLFYGFKTNDWRSSGACRISPEGNNPYFATELAFDSLPASTNGPRFLATMLTAELLAEAMRTVDRGVASDSAFPTQTVLLQKTTDSARNVRFPNFDNAILDMQLNGLFPLIATNSNQTSGLSDLLGMQTGLARFDVTQDTFVPGAMADSLTSYGGCLFEPCGQTNLLAFLRAGATASYGTVVEPCNYTEKFPDPSVYFYQARGFTIAECCYQGLASPYQGVLVGEPLAAPFARPGIGTWGFQNSHAAPATGIRPPDGVGLHEAPPPSEPPVLVGPTHLSLQFLAADATRPLQQVDLFVDGVLACTVTNLPPAEGNTLSIGIGPTVFDWAVPAGAALESLTTNLAALINSGSNATLVAATAVGDRLELASLLPGRSGEEVSLTGIQSQGSAPALTTFVRPATPRFIDSAARPWRFYTIDATAAEGDVLRCTLIKTNGDNITVGATNQPAGTTASLVRQVLQQVNDSPMLHGPDGVSAEDIFVMSDNLVSFFLYARSPGLAAAQIECAWTAPDHFQMDPSAPVRLNENGPDLAPRNHLYLTAGSTNLDLTFPFDTTAYPDGHHELTAVAYEGSSVRTPTRATARVRIRNTPLEATLRCPVGQTEFAVEAAVPFDVMANRMDIDRIELFGTGGWLAGMTNSQTAAFALPGTELGAGQHSVVAVVTASDGARYQTAPFKFRLIGPEVPVTATISPTPPTLFWTSVYGRTYEVLEGATATSIGDVAATITASSTGVTSWRIPTPLVTARFYRVRVR